MSSTSASRGRMPRHLLALASSIVLTAGVGIATAPSAFAADPPDTSASHASAQYLSVTGGPSTPGATADYYGNNTDTPDAAQQQSSAVASVDTSSVPGLTIQGAVGSAYAYAGTGGSSWAASGRVTGPGGSGVVDPANVNIDLGALLGTSRIVEKMELSLKEVSGIAASDAANPNALATKCTDWSAPDNCRDYTLKSGKLHIESSAIAGVMADIQTLAAQIDTSIGTLSADLPDALTNALVAPINATLSGSLTSLPPLDLRIPLVGGHTYAITSASLDDPKITVAVSGTVLATLTSILAASHTVHGVTLDLGAGTIDVDYATVMGDLNDLDPNTPLFGTAVTASITDSVNDIISDIADEIAKAVPDLLKAINVSVTATATPEASVTDTTYKWKWDNIRKRQGHWEVNGSPVVTAMTGLSVGGTFSGTLYDILNGGATVSLSLSGWPTWLDALGLPAPTVGSITVPGLPGGLSQTIIDGAKAAAVTAIQGAVDPAIAAVMGVLNSASSVFGGTINVQQDNADGSFRETALELWFNPGGKKASPLRGGGGAFRAAAAPAAYVGPPAGAVVVRLGTAIVGKNQAATVCPAGTHYDATTRPPSCVKDSTPGGGVPGGGTPATTTTPVTTTTTAPSTEVLGSSDTTTSPSVTVKGESSEAPQTTEVLGLAETGPHDVALIAVLGLELLLGGIAIIRLTARRRRELTDQHHV